ncbi:MAG: protease modulator HflK, partial [Rhodospirillales bacterium]
MAWNPHGGGQGPWGGGGGGGGGPTGPQPPDIEEMLRRGQERFKSFMPGGMKPSRSIFLIVIALVGIWLASGFYRVDAAQQGVVMLFGKHVQSTGPGLHWYFPTPIGSVLTPDVEKVRRTDIGFRSADVRTGRGTSQKVTEESLMLTSDQNIVDLNFSVQWKVKNASDFVFKIRGPEMTVKRAAESAMREV